MNKRVVITGLGVISSIGTGKEKFWDSLIKGNSGISRISSIDTSNYHSHYGGEVKNFNPGRFICHKEINRMGRASQFAVSATKLALEDAKLNLTDIFPERVGVSVGTTMGEPQVFEQFNKIWIKEGERFIDSGFIFQYSYNVLSSNIAIEFKFKGYNITLPVACAAGNYAIGYGCDLIRAGKADIMVVGGVDVLSRVAFAGFNRLYAVAPEKCQPFDKNRKGMLLGEGAGILILESLEGALERETNIYAEILGYSLGCDAHHMTAPNADGIARVIENAITDANLKARDIHYISAHGTGTVSNDKTECLAIKKVFKNYRDIPVSSIKSMLGHTMGAASAIEAIACALTVKYDIIPPTINYETPDSECDIDCVPNVLKKQRVDVALNNAFAFGGNNACLVIKKYTDFRR